MYNKEDNSYSFMCLLSLSYFSMHYLIQDTNNSRVAYSLNGTGNELFNITDEGLVKVAEEFTIFRLIQLGSSQYSSIISTLVNQTYLLNMVLAAFLVKSYELDKCNFFSLLWIFDVCKEKPKIHEV